MTAPQIPLQKAHPGAYLRAAIQDGVRIERPFRHWLVSYVLPPRLYAGMRDFDLVQAMPADGSGRRESANATRIFFTPEVRAASDKADQVAGAFQAPETIDLIQEMTGADLEGAHLRIEYCVDTAGFWLEPHTDIAVKRFTMLVYLSDCPGSEAWGTDLLDAAGNLASRAKAWPDSGVIFIPAGDTWHGFAERPIEGERRSLIINYVGPEWRAGEELCFPDHPVTALRSRSI